MEFGRISIAEIDQVDFTLPTDPSMNSTILPGESSGRFRFNLGMDSWGRTEWVGIIYPPKIQQKDFLSYYGQHFNAIELNSTHYKIYAETYIQKWKEQVNNSNFIFCPKMYKGVTHFGSLRGKEELTTNFLKGISSFNEQLGPVFVQLSDSFSPTRIGELKDFLTSLPTHITFFLELRHPHWFINESIFHLLRELNIGAVITDSPGRRDCVHMHLTVPKLFVRFVANDRHPTYTERIIDWAKRIKFWQSKGLEEVNFFIHAQDELVILEVVKNAIETFNEVCNAGLKPLKLSDQSLF